MSRIFVTGDLHGEIDMHKLSTAAFPEQRELTKDDFIIICGDFGCVWDGGKTDKHMQKWLSEKPFTTLFLDGNHEAFPLLNAYPVEEWNGGKVHFITPSIIHLMRGQVFTINGVKCFTMGGAASHDKQFRKEGVSWWPEEMPTDAEYDEAFESLGHAGWKVNFVFTHCAPDSIQAQLADWYEHDKLTNFLEIVRQDLVYDYWFFGHYHTNKMITAKDIVLYERIVGAGEWI